MSSEVVQPVSRPTAKSKVSGWCRYTPSVGLGITAELRRNVAEVSGYTGGPVLQPDGAADEMLEE